MDLPPPVPIHKLFIEYVFLNELSKYTKGISGYRLRKAMNKIITHQIGDEEKKIGASFSQSMVYRVFKELKTKGVIDAESKVDKGRAKNLYWLNEKGKKRLQTLKKIITNLAPIEADPSLFAEEFLSGKISPIQIFDKISKNFPKDKLLERLKLIRKHLTKALQNLDAKIEEVEKELSVK